MGKWILVMTMIMVSGCLNSSKKPVIRLYVASSMSETMQEIGQKFEELNDVKVIYNFASSGALAQQLIASPQGELFFSANEEWVNVLDKKRMIRSRKEILTNQLVVIANIDSTYEIKDPASLPYLPFEHLSIGDPHYVPAGRYAMEWLSNIPSPVEGTVWDNLQPKLSPAPDVRSSLMQVEGSIDAIGIVYATDYAHRNHKLKLLYEVPLEDGPKIIYSMAVMKDGKEKNWVNEFLYFLEKPEVYEIFKRHGFKPIIVEPEE